MNPLTECGLDRHFATQVRNLRLFTREHPISQKDIDLSQRWLDHLQQATGQDKYARNCIMLMMNDQLREIGHLRKPFTEMKNVQRCMDDLLNEYDGGTVEEQPMTAAVKEAEEIMSTASSYGGGSSRCSKEATVKNPLPEFDSVKQANQDLLKEIDSLHSRTVEAEQHYRSRSLMLEKKMAEKFKVDQQELQQECIYQACREAIALLKNWSGGEMPLNFLATCFEPFLRNELVTSPQISKLDCSLEDILNGIMNQACARREKNVRMLYDHIQKHQHEILNEKEGKVRQMQEYLKQERQRLRVLSDDLKRREVLIWSHQSAVTGRPLEEPSSPRITECEYCLWEKSLKARPIDPTCRICQLEKSKSAEELEKLSDVLSDLSVDKW
ncbi:uncharacterized protein LOC108037069 [Drosophila rhopaloa]|uniref:Uncharacterized protein LOC108037069 n=1 Tax=Drosophila rhopaloa TaxID=1041015 RepID=A0A6P4DU20_DRORH|nr:uncharacterized protein LOC108037069 [Drosophila rhopaloa]